MQIWSNLQLPPLDQAWGNFPPILRALIVLTFALTFAMFFVKDYNRGGKRYALYGPVAVALFVYSASLFGFF